MSPSLWMAVGVAQCRAEQWQDAIDSLLEADWLQGDNSCVHFFLAMAHWQVGERPEAFAWYEKAVARLHAHEAHYHDFVTLRKEADACIGSAIAIGSVEQLEGPEEPGSQTMGSTGSASVVVTSLKSKGYVFAGARSSSLFARNDPGFFTPKALHSIALGRSEAAHPGFLEPNPHYAEGVTQGDPHWCFGLCNPYRGIRDSVALFTQGALCGFAAPRPWALECNAFGVNASDAQPGNKDGISNIEQGVMNEERKARMGGTGYASEKATTDFVFTITRFGDTSGSVVVDWATSDGTAKAGRDYVPAFGQLHFSSGITQQHVTVSVYHDLMAESTEDFVVSLVDVAGAEVAQRRAIGTIVNDDRQENIDKWHTAIRYRDDSAVTHFKRAVAYCLQTDQDQDQYKNKNALADLTRAIEIEPDFAKAYFNRSIIRQRQGDSEQALADLEQALQLGLQTASLINNRGVIHAAASEPRYEAVLTDFDQAIKLGPPRAEVYNNRGVIQVSRGKLQLAISDFAKAIQINPDFTMAYANRAITRALLGDVEAALKDVATAMELDPQIGSYDGLPSPSKPGTVRRASKSVEAIGNPQKLTDLEVHHTGTSQHRFAPVAVEWVNIPDLENETLRRFRDEAARLMGATQADSANEQQLEDSKKKAAGEPPLATKELTGQASLERMVCTPGKMTVAIISQIADLRQKEFNAMLIAQMKKRLQNRRRHLRMEPLEQRNLLTGISGTVFEDINGDGVQDPGELGMAGETVVLERVGGGGGPSATILNPFPGSDDGFGAVDAVGDDILVGASGDDAGGIVDAGEAYIFTRSDTPDEWELRLTLENPAPAPGDNFGKAACAIDNTVFIGTRLDDAQAVDAGAVYVFDATNGSLTQTLYSPLPTEDSRFGTSVEAMGQKVLISSVGETHLYSFDASSTSWQLEHTFEDPDPEEGDDFGRAVGIGDNTVLIADKRDQKNTAGDGVGAVYLYHFDGGEWALTAKIISPDGMPGDHFGSRIAAVGGGFAVGAWGIDTANAIDVGAAYLLDGSTGRLLQTFSNPSPMDNDRMDNVKAFGSNVLVGVPEADTGAADAGIGYLFDSVTGEVLKTLNNPTPELGEGFGKMGAIGSNILVGTASANDTGVAGAGVVYVFNGIITATTDANGDYSFTDLDPDDYVIRQIAPDGFSQTTPGGDGTHSVTVGDGANVTGIDFGNQWDPVLVFGDSFENGQWDDLWVEDSQNDWFTSTQRATEGSYSAEVDGYASNATLTTADSIDLTPYGGAELTFDWYIEKGFDSGEYLALDLFDGGSWIEVARLSGNVDQENTWHTETIPIDGAYLVDNFQFQFRAKVSRYNEDANVDNVRLIGTSLNGPPNTVPVAVGDAYSVLEDGGITVADPGVLGNDSDGDDDPLTADLVTDTTDGTLTLNTDGSFAYTPGANFNGTDSFTYRAYDGRDFSSPATVTITVTPVNDLPVAVADNYTVDQDDLLTVAAAGVLSNDTDIDNDPLTAVLDAGTDHGTLDLNADGSFTYTSDSGYSGMDSFTYAANDGSADSNVVTVNIEVTEPVAAFKLDTGTVLASTDTWTTITLDQTYTNMVVVLTPNYDSGDAPMVARVDNASGNSFSVKLDRADGDTEAIAGIPVHYMVVEEGVYTAAEHGVTMEAAYSIDLPNAEVAVVSQAAMDGANGGWAVLYGENPVSSTNVTLAIDEDKLKDTERKHTTEQVSYIVFGSGTGSASAISLDTNDDGQVTPYDALLVINWLSADHAGRPSHFSATLDVNRDGHITPLDSLMVINRLNSQIGTAPEGESNRMELATTTASGLIALDQIFAHMEDEDVLVDDFFQ